MTLEDTAVKESTELVSIKDIDKVPETRLEAVLGLRLAGAPFSYIARDLGFVNAYAAQAAYERALAVTAMDVKDRERARALQSERLDRLLMSVWEKALKPERSKDRHLEYVRTALGIIDRQAKLQGADAPTQIEVHQPKEAEITAWVEDKKKELGIDGLNREADILEAEIVEDTSHADTGE